MFSLSAGHVCFFVTILGAPFIVWTALPQDCEAELPSDVLWNISYEYGKKGMFDESRLCFELFASIYPDDIKAWCLLSEIHGRIGNFDGALSHARIAARIGGETSEGAEGTFLLANAYMSVHNYGLAKHTYYKAIRLDPQHVNSMVNLGVVLGNNNDFAEAIPLYQHALKIKPDIMAARHNLGSALHTLKHHAHALAILEPLVKDEPDCFECLLSLGHALSEVKTLERSKDMYKRAMDIRPWDADALLNYYHTKQQVIDWEERDFLFEKLKNVTEEQLSQRHLTTVGPYYSLLSPFDSEQMLGIAESHAIRALEKVEVRGGGILHAFCCSLGRSPCFLWFSRTFLQVRYKIPFLPASFGMELEPPLYRLRVGYIMADFRHHVTAHLLQVRDQMEGIVTNCSRLSSNDTTRSVLKSSVML
eukprot:117628-Hanusia_phi.AAC.3